MGRCCREGGEATLGMLQVIVQVNIIRMFGIKMMSFDVLQRPREYQLLYGHVVLPERCQKAES